jgi:hypothetical protein
MEISFFSSYLLIAQSSGPACSRMSVAMAGRHFPEEIPIPPGRGKTVKRDGAYDSKAWGALYHFEIPRGGIRGLVLRALSKKRHLHAQLNVSFMDNSGA